MPGFLRLVDAACLMLAAWVSAATDPVGDPVEGHRLALKICTACHVVAADQENAPTLRKPAPSFEAIAKKPGVTADWVRNFLLTIHRTFANGTEMPNPQLTDDQAADIAAYIAGLQPAKQGAKP